MVYIFSALYAEAQPLIEKYRLKKKCEVHGVDSFQDEDGRMILSLTGCGVYRAVFAVSSVLAVIPPGPADQLLFFGSAAYVKQTERDKNNPESGCPLPDRKTASVSGLYRIREISDLASGRRYYPDLLRETGLPDAVAVTGMHVLYRQQGSAQTDVSDSAETDDSDSTWTDKPAVARSRDLKSVVQICRDIRQDVPVLYDMESAGIYEAASRHMGPHQITILRFVSDEGLDAAADPLACSAEDPAYSAADPDDDTTDVNIGTASPAGVRQAMRIALYRKSCAAAPAAEQVIDSMMRHADVTAAGKRSDGEFLAERLHCSASMHSELMQYLKYADLAGISWRRAADKILQNGCADRRVGKRLLRSLESEILASGDTADEEFPERRREENSTVKQTGKNLLPSFRYIYIECAIADHPRTERILTSFPGAERIYVENYREIFDRHRQSYPLQRASRALILARNTGELIHRGSPVCQSFDNRYFYYCSSVMNCPYDCDYCWLKGMYESGNLVIFVNLEDTFREVERLLRGHPVYLCVSYDTDLLALEPLTGYARQWSEFAASHENLTIEIRTKGVAHLPELVRSERTILAFTLSPDETSRRFERQAPGTEMRIADIREAMKRQFSVRLCFDPVIVCPGWKKSMSFLMEELDREIDWRKVRDVSIGTFRISADYIRRMRSRYPDSVLLQYPYVCSDGYYHLPDEIEKDALQYMTELLEERTGTGRLFFWQG